MIEQYVGIFEEPRGQDDDRRNGQETAVRNDAEDRGEDDDENGCARAGGAEEVGDEPGC